ncbi:MAG: hypothetical protein ACXVFF_07935 [Gaiellaceae bacterium]
MTALLVSAVRPNAWNLPLFLHVAGAMTLFGALGTTLVLSLAGLRRPGAEVLARGALLSLLATALPAWALMRVAAQWTYSKEHFSGHNDPAWLGIGFGVSDAGLIVLLAALGLSYAWTRSLRPWAPKALGGVGGLYLVLLAVAWLAMSGKWS